MPTTDYKRDERIQVIHQCLKNAAGKWSVKKLLEKVNNHLEDNNGKIVSARTIDSDLKYLEFKKFAPVIPIKRGRDVYYTYDDDFELNKPIITQDESFSLVIANQILQQLNGFTLSKDLKRITKKLQYQIDDSDTEKIISFEEVPALKNIHLLQDLFECIKETTVIKIQYKHFKAIESAEKIIHPYLLKQYNQRWFLFGYDESNNRIDNSPLDRIETFKPTSLVFNTKEKEQLKDWFENIIGVTKPDESIQKIVLHFTGITGNYIATKPLHISQITNWLNDDTLEVTLQLIINYELERLILSYANTVKIIQPISLAEKIKKKLEEALEIDT